MLVCSCNIITREEIVSVIRDMLLEDEWQLIVPVQVYHEMGKRGRCCGCFPNLVSLIVQTTEAFHRDMQSDEKTVLTFISKLKEKHEQCETARMLARHKIRNNKVA